MALASLSEHSNRLVGSTVIQIVVTPCPAGGYYFLGKGGYAFGSVG